jgi:hypothetical protein
MLKMALTANTAIRLRYRCGLGSAALRLDELLQSVNRAVLWTLETGQAAHF